MWLKNHGHESTKYYQKWDKNLTEFAINYIIETTLLLQMAQVVAVDLNCYWF